MSKEAVLRNAYFQSVPEMVQGPGSALLQDFLFTQIGTRVCFVLVERSDVRFTIVIDEQWANLALQLRSPGQSLCQEDDFTIPRAAMKAVIADWPESWDSDPSPALTKHYSPDDIPHLSVLGLYVPVNS